MKKCWSKKKNKNLAEQFLDIFERLIKGESIELFDYELSGLFEIAASRLIDCPLTFDGATNLNSKGRKSRQIVFDGKMWLLIDKNYAGDWFESFEAVVTDKRITKQGLWIKIRVGEYEEEGNLLEFLE